MILDFGSYIDEKARLFIGREWVFQDISDWLGQPNSARYFLLTGEPGSGKTALAARLVQFSAGSAHPPARSEMLSHDFLSAIHFCRAGAPSWLDARTFARSISLQLTSIPEFKQALIAVGDRDVNIDVQQRVDTAHSGASITGVHIENLVISGLSGQEAFNRTVLDPLRAIYNQGYGQPIVVLVDSLDEALAHTADTSIVDLLANLQDVAPQVRLIVTSRQEPRVENKFRTVDELFLSAPNYKSANDTDIRVYVSSCIEHDEQLRRMATLAASQASVLADDITVKAEGNFQYVTFLLKALAEQQLALNDVAGLPPGLDGLYFDSLDRVVKLGKKDWATTYKPVLGVLSVAQEPLTFEQVEAFAQLTSDAWDALGDLLQFIETVPSSQKSDAELLPAAGTPDTEDRYRLYHQSAVDFLRRRQLTMRNGDKTKMLHNLYFLAADDWHKRVVATYESKTGEQIEIDWSQNNGIVSYGLRHLTSHLYQLRAVADYLAKLHVLLHSDVFIDRRLVVVPNPNLVLDDLRLTLDLALQNDDLPRVWAYILKYRRVLRNERDFEQIKQAVADHRYTLALERTALYSYLPNSQALARLWVAWTAAANGHANHALVIAQHALGRLPPREISAANTQATHPVVAYAVDEALQRLLIRIARTVAAGHEEQRDWLRQAVRAWPSKEQVLDRCAERLDAWGEILEATQVDKPMQQLIEELKQRVRQIDAPFGGIRDAAVFYRNKLAAGLFNTRNDGPVWLDYVRQTVDLLALDDYPSYREMALLWVSTAILAQENEEIARSALAIVLGGVFKPEPGFWGDTIAAALDGLARESNQGTDPEYVLALLENVEAKSERDVDPTVPRKLEPIIEWRKKVGLPTDPWSLRMRRRSAVAAVVYRRGDRAGAEQRLEQAGAESYKGSYAGFRTLARLSLACRWLEWRGSPKATEQIEAAWDDADNMLDQALKRERLDLVNKIRDWAKEVGQSLFALAEQDALAQLQQKLGMEHRLYVEFLSAVWHDDAARLKRLLPLTLDDATTTDAVLGRLLGIEAMHMRADRPFLALVRTMNLAADPEG